MAEACIDGRTLAIRADGDNTIGTGHLMRCLALADAWQRAGGIARLHCAAIPDAIRDRYRGMGVRVDIRPAWSAADVATGADVVLLDGQHLPDTELSALSGTRVPLVVIDDHGWRPRYPCALVLNQNAYAEPGLYAGKTTAELCLGPRWCLLRREFADPAPRVVSDRVERVLILMGGADPTGRSALALDATERAARALPGDIEAVLVVGAANPALDALTRHAAGLRIRAAVHHDVRNLVPLMASADLAISAAGSTIWELAALGTPMILGAQNEGERGTAAVLAVRGAALDLGLLDRLDVERLVQAIVEVAGDVALRKRMSRAGQALVDGRGADRTAARIAGLFMGEAA